MCKHRLICPWWTVTGSAAINRGSHHFLFTHWKRKNKRVVWLWQHLTSYIFQTWQISGSIFANSEQLLNTAKRFPFSSLDFYHVGSIKLFHFPSLNFFWMHIGVSNANKYSINILKHGGQEIIFFIKQIFS